MWKFEVCDIGDFHYRQLKALVRHGLADAHIIVTRLKVDWPQTWDAVDRKARSGVPRGVAIN